MDSYNYNTCIPYLQPRLVSPRPKYRGELAGGLSGAGRMRYAYSAYYHKSELSEFEILTIFGDFDELFMNAIKINVFSTRPRGKKRKGNEKNKNL